MNTNTAATITDQDIRRMADILSRSTSRLMVEENLSIPVAYAYVRRAFEQRYPNLATLVPATFSDLLRRQATR